MTHPSSKKRLAEMAEYMEACALIARNGADIHNGSKELREHADMVTAIASYLSSAVETSPVHADPTGTTREPPHCPTCACGAPETTGEVQRLHETFQEVMALLAYWLDADRFNNIEQRVLDAGVPYPSVKASEPQCICATTAEPLRLVDPQCPKHSTRGCAE
jgi:hypothetical protein